MTFLGNALTLAQSQRKPTLVTIDVVDLYPHIPHDEGLAAIREALNKREDQEVSTDAIVDLPGTIILSLMKTINCKN